MKEKTRPFWEHDEQEGKVKASKVSDTYKTEWEVQACSNLESSPQPTKRDGDAIGHWFPFSSTLDCILWRRPVAKTKASSKTKTDPTAGMWKDR